MTTKAELRAGWMPAILLRVVRMKPARSIAELMLKDHELLLGIFNDFKSTKMKNKQAAARLFKRFDSELRSHFKVEEQIISAVFRKQDGRENLLPIANSIRLEHRRIRRALLLISSLLQEGTVFGISDLYLMLRHHKNIEERLFYPRLDEILSEKEKSYVEGRIRR